MTLYVIRHAIAEDEAPGGDDGARRLTPRGREKFRAEVAGLRALGAEIDILLTSPLVRAVETAAILADGYDGVPTPRELAALAGGVPPAETLRALRPFVRHDGVAIVGHEPGLSGLASLVLCGRPDALGFELKKGGILAIDVRASSLEGGGTLRWMLTPRQLRQLGR
jgi:phosphohistidine phosphatase